MPTSPMPAPAPWREVPCPEPSQRGFFRLICSGAPILGPLTLSGLSRIAAVQSIQVDRARLRYSDARPEARVELTATSDLELVVVLGCVDEATCAIVAMAWHWRRELIGRSGRGVVEARHG